MSIEGTARVRRAHRSAGRTLGLLLLVALAACDFLDPTRVENPQTTTDDLAAAPEPTAAFLAGLRAQFSRMIGSQIVIAEVASDNYSIHGTGLPPVWDNIRDVSPSDVNLTGFTTGIYWNMQELRALADFVLSDIVPGDDTALPSHVAEIHYYRGMALLLLGENFSAAPTVRDGEARTSADLIGMAVTDFTEVLNLAPTGSFALPAGAAIARSHRAVGNRTNAVAAAGQVLGAGAIFAFQQLYDATSIENQPHIFLVVRALKEMQPLPRLDFLDPKYVSRGAAITVAKAEEMHLILAEAALSTGDVPAARGHLRDAIALATSRATVEFVDDDPRLNANLTIRPRSSSIVVRADADSPFRAGLVLDRPGEIQVPTISATSLDADSVFALTTDDEVWHAFHLARQEILFLEGRRMSDLGIRLPMMLREIEQNPNISEGGPGTVSVIPSYIPAGAQMNQFDPASPYDADGTLLQTEVTILWDLNRILATQRVNAFPSS